MAGKQVSGEGLSTNLAGMSKNQLYDIMSQMKVTFYHILFLTPLIAIANRLLFFSTQNLIEQNQQQAKQILIQNPMLTKALFQVSFQNATSYLIH